MQSYCRCHSMLTSIRDCKPAPNTVLDGGLGRIYAALHTPDLSLQENTDLINNSLQGIAN